MMVDLTQSAMQCRIDREVMEMGRRKAKYQWDSESIHALREYLGMTQRQMADELGTRQQTISEWETGMYRPRGGMNRLLTLVAEGKGFEYEVVVAKVSSGEDEKEESEP